LKHRRGITAEELRARVREQEREQAHRKAVEAEARAVQRALKPQEGGQTATAFQVSPLPGSSIRKDSPPVKVRVLFRFVARRALTCVLAAIIRDT
jgi:ribosomal protein L16/L10AE